jgi:hypothetical protein
MAAKFLIEVPHEVTTLECLRAIEAVLKSGSHFLTHADWGCKDGEHKAWFTAEVENKEEARAIVPPAFRSKAKIVQLNSFSLDEVEEILRNYKP